MQKAREHTVYTQHIKYIFFASLLVGVAILLSVHIHSLIDPFGAPFYFASLTLPHCLCIEQYPKEKKISKNICNIVCPHYIHTTYFSHRSYHRNDVNEMKRTHTHTHNANDNIKQTTKKKRNEVDLLSCVSTRVCVYLTPGEDPLSHQWNAISIDCNHCEWRKCKTLINEFEWLRYIGIDVGTGRAGQRANKLCYPHTQDTQHTKAKGEEEEKNGNAADDGGWHIQWPDR